MADGRLAPMTTVVDGLSRLLAASPDPVIAGPRVRDRRPATAGDLPTVAISLQLGEPALRGLGRLIAGERPGPRPGDPPVPERRGLQLNGVATLELWAASHDGISGIARRLDERLADRSTAVRHGFPMLEPASLSAAEHATRPGASGSDFRVWWQRFEYRFRFETWPVPEPGGGIIDRIDVELSHLPDPGPEELMVVPSRPSTEGG